MIAGALRSLVNVGERLAASSSYALLVLACAAVIGPTMIPVQWSGNEINYFDLAYRFVRPEEFGDLHAVFDSSHGRAASFFLIGHAIVLFGFDGAKTVVALLVWALYAISLAAVARALGLRVAESVAALLIFLLAGQSSLGGEWLFGTVEAKVFAYPAVLLGIAGSLVGRWRLAMICVAIATSFHFLVGGYWGSAILGLHLLTTGRPGATLRLAALFFVLILPVFAVLLRERIGVQVDLSGLDQSLDNIYAEYRSPHHVAPFRTGHGFLISWLPGLITHIGLALTLTLSRLGAGRNARATLAWLTGLNLYVVLAMGLAFADRDTNALAALYMFRPSALILLLSCMALVRKLASAINPEDYQAISAVALLLSLFLILPEGASSLGRIVLKVPPPAHRLEAALTSPEAELVDWLRATTPPSAAILVEPPEGRTSLLEGSDPFSAGLERLTGRPTIVNFKFVPTSKPDLVIWYRRLQDRTAAFSGECGKLEALSATVVVARLQETWARLQPCAEELFRNGAFIAGRVRPAAKDDAPG